MKKHYYLYICISLFLVSCSNQVIKAKPANESRKIVYKYAVSIPIDVVKYLLVGSTSYGFYGDNKAYTFVEYLNYKGAAECVVSKGSSATSALGAWSIRGNTFCFQYGNSRLRDCYKLFLTDLGIVYENIANKNKMTITKLENKFFNYDFDVSKGLTVSGLKEINEAVLKVSKLKKTQAAHVKSPVSPVRLNLLPRSVNSRVRNVRSSQNQCEEGHWIQSVSSNGEIIKLEDGSIWQVNSVDSVVSSIWLSSSSVLVCDYKLINTDDNETVEASRLN